MGESAWYGKNARDAFEKYAHIVGQKKPNPWGLHDMHGNVWEWCQDWWGVYPTGHVTNPVVEDTGPGRVLRGGSFYLNAADLRSANRNDDQPDNRFNDVGFRAARTYP